MKHFMHAEIWQNNAMLRSAVSFDLADDGKQGVLLPPHNTGLDLGGQYFLVADDFRSEIAIASEADSDGRVEFAVHRNPVPDAVPVRPSYPTPEQVTERVMADGSVTLGEIAEHFDGTTFWNYAGSIETGLNDGHRQPELPLTLQSKGPDDGGTIRHELWYESGETTIHVGSMYENEHMDETCHKIDAEFVACLPVYIPALFREIYRLRDLLLQDNVDPPENDNGKTGLGRVKRYMQGIEATNRVLLVKRFREFEAEIRQEMYREPEIQITHNLSLEKMVEELNGRLRGLKVVLLEVANKVGIDAAAKAAAERQQMSQVIAAVEEQGKVKSPDYTESADLAPSELSHRICNTFRGLTLSWVEVMHIVRHVERCAAGDPHRGVAVVLKPQPVSPRSPWPLVALQDLAVGDRFAEDDDTLVRYVVTMKHGGDVMARDEDTGEEQTFGNAQKVLKLPPKG